MHLQTIKPTISLFANSLFLLFGFLLLLPGSGRSQTSPLTATNLRCEYSVNPIWIEDQHPRLSWNFVMQGRNQVQRAYEIIVSTNASMIAKGEGDVWKSGKIHLGENVNIAYSGKPLSSFKRYYWSVRAYSENDEPGAWSTPAYFQTAMLQPSDWKGKWISDGSVAPSVDADAFKPDRMPLFKKEIVSGSKKISRATLCISGLGYYEAYLNGQKIGTSVLDPGWTTYRKEVLYAVHDVTAMLKTRSILSVMLGNGWWNPVPIKLFGRWDLREYQQTGRPCFISQLHLVYEDGSTETIGSDETWLTAPGPIFKNSVYLGEHYDARLEQPNFASSDKSGWKNAVTVSGPVGKLSAQRQNPIRVTRVIKPVKISSPAKDTFIVDMGQNFAGVARIKVKGKAGTRVTLRYGEAIFKDGSINVSTTVMTQIRKGGIPAGPGAPETTWQEDSYTLKGKGTEVWAPRFTFHGFRYVEVVGWPGTPTVNDIEGLRMNTDFEEAGTFTSSNPTLNRVQELVQWTFLSNVFSVQSDCPAREKMGYGADMVVSANAFIYNYGMENFYRKAVTDFANDQQPDGAITEIAPFTGIADRGYGGNSGPLGWQLAFPFLQKQLYDFYGDKRLIEENYKRLKDQIEFLKSKSYQGLFHWDIGDHEALDPRAEAFSAAAFYYHHAILAAEFAGVMKQPKDSTAFASLAAQIKRSIVRKYHVPNTGRFDNATQAAQVMALWYNLSPEKDKTFDVLMKEFERHDFHVSSGIFGVKMMFDVLREHDMNEVAYKVASQKTYPGWGHMVESGATTLWEQWKYPELYASQNHPMFGSISEWFFRSLGGINPGSPGFKKIIIKPQPAGDLTSVKATYNSIHGKISSEWRKEGGKFSLNVTVPANTTADVWLPAKGVDQVREDGAVLSSKKLNAITRGEYVVVNVGSGDYRFEVNVQ